MTTDMLNDDPRDRGYRALADMLIDAAQRIRTLAPSVEGKAEDAA